MNMNYNLWAAIVGFLGLLIPTTYTYQKNRKFQQQINELNKLNTGDITFDDKMKILDKIEEYKRQKNEAINKMTLSVFFILVISYIFQILGGIKL